MLITPKLVSTYPGLDPFEWEPESFEAFQEELEHIVVHAKEKKHNLLFRGQSDCRWLLDSTFVRWAKENVLGISPLSKLPLQLRSSLQINLLLGEIIAI